MSTTTIYAFRHSETYRNKAGIEIQGWINDTAAMLNETGIQGAHDLGKALSNFCPHPVAIYSSDLARALDTANIVASYYHHQCPIIKDPGIREKCHGPHDTMSVQIRNSYCLEYYQRHQKELEDRHDRFAKWRIEPLSLQGAPPETIPACSDPLETIYDVFVRGSAAFKQFGNKHLGETILVSSHGAFNDIIATEAENRHTRDLLPVYFEPKARHFPKNCAVYHFTWDGKNQELLFEGQVDLMGKS